MILQFCRFQSLLSVVFSLFSVFKFEYEKFLKIWKFKMEATGDVMYVAVVAMETN